MLTGLSASATNYLSILDVRLLRFHDSLQKRGMIMLLMRIPLSDVPVVIGNDNQ